MRIKSFLQSYIKTLLPLTAPFLILSLCRLLLPIDMNLLIYGFSVSLIGSFFLAHNLREVHFMVDFKNRREYLNSLTKALANLGFILKSTEGFLTIYEHRNLNLFKREIKVYLFRDRALIIAPRKYTSLFRKDQETKLSLFFRYFA
ncbi:hypothetical protein Desaci_1916 [Desulfosporosinus acidiphilus SJ4]|uniref:Uncharacterized protein n=1 Tax=Desulfosporosinus acidiphilus (strain DSM 22704 / JCM 16185 / SJ4) TaxID=646529 RepID=I4D519_DESAJ|nr:hypothetical protein [Desulfosporosinus acidiphilus]AFM40893.1 hypothetical protein Desaci_1916 [Desulfosporosinus acidiphilus SJ4]